MKLDGFIEVEEAEGRTVKHCCDMFEVSRTAYYQRKRQVPSPRVVTEAQLTEKIRRVHKDSDGIDGSPRVHRELLDRAAIRGRRRVRQLMRLAGLEGHCKKRWRKNHHPRPGHPGRGP